MIFVNKNSCETLHTVSWPISFMISCISFFCANQNQVYKIFILAWYSSWSNSWCFLHVALKILVFGGLVLKFFLLASWIKNSKDGFDWFKLQSFIVNKLRCDQLTMKIIPYIESIELIWFMVLIITFMTFAFKKLSMLFCLLIIWKVIIFWSHNQSLPGNLSKVIMKTISIFLAEICYHQDIIIIFISIKLQVLATTMVSVAGL